MNFLFNKWSSQNTLVKKNKIIIFGAGGAARSITEIIDPLRTEIVAYVDNDPNKQGSGFCNKSVIAPQQLSIVAYDGIFIASAFHKEIISQLLDLGIPEASIINTQALLFDMTVDTLLSNLVRQKNEIEVIITGKSYAMLGISPKYIDKKAVNLANNGQDIYYDFKLADHLINTLQAPKLRHCFIGLTYFGFHYDLSKRQDNLSTARYYPVFHDVHHAENILPLMNILKKHLKPNYAKLLRGMYRKENEGYFLGKHNCDYTFFRRNFPVPWKASEIAQNEFKKNYPETVQENKILFERMLLLLEENGIQPVVIIVPGHPDYIRHVSLAMEREFKLIIEEFQKKHSFIFLDWLRLDSFNENDFYDDSHMNEGGAKKLTLRLNQYLQ